jgi:hypothetical protein
VVDADEVLHFPRLIPLSCMSTCPERSLLALALLLSFYIAIKFGVNRIEVDDWAGVWGSNAGGGS